MEGSLAIVDKAFALTAAQLTARVGLLVGLPFDELDGPTLTQRIDEIGRIQDESTTR